MVIGNLKAVADAIKTVSVSVPLRGNGYRKSNYRVTKGLEQYSVSVPLRGNGYRKLHAQN